MTEQVSARARSDALAHEKMALADELEGERRRLAVGEERFRSIVETHADMVWVADWNGHMRHAVPAWCALTGQKPEETLGLGWIDVDPPGRPGTHLAAVGRRGDAAAAIRGRVPGPQGVGRLGHRGEPRHPAPARRREDPRVGGHDHRRHHPPPRGGGAAHPLRRCGGALRHAGLQGHAPRGGRDGHPDVRRRVHRRPGRTTRARSAGCRCPGTSRRRRSRSCGGCPRAPMRTRR